MAKRISIKLSTLSIDSAIEQLRAYRDGLPGKVLEACRRLAQSGAVEASLGFARAEYDGEKNVSISIEAIPNGYAILARGETVLILEFGAGMRYGYGHPLANDFGMGPGTYPNANGHWDDPTGWWIPKAHGGGHTYGNPPAAVMYSVSEALRKEANRVLLEVLEE